MLGLNGAYCKACFKVELHQHRNAGATDTYNHKVIWLHFPEQSRERSSCRCRTEFGSSCLLQDFQNNRIRTVGTTDLNLSQPVR